MQVGAPRKVWVINQTGGKLFPYPPNKYGKIVQQLAHDPKIEIANPRELKYAPPLLPAPRKFVEYEHGVELVCTEVEDPSVDAENYRRHAEYHKASMQAAEGADALPIVLADSHEFTLGAFTALAGMHPNLQMLFADTHLDSSSDSFSPSGFIRYGIGEHLVSPYAIQMFGAAAPTYHTRSGRERVFRVSHELIERVPSSIMEMIFMQRMGLMADGVELGISLEALKETARFAMPDKWDEASIKDALSTMDGMRQFFEINMVIWERIYLFKSGSWIDLDQLCKRVDYQGKPVFFSFDTDVSMFMNRDPKEVMGNMAESLRTGRLVGMHVTEAESRDTLWSAEQIYQVMRTAIFNGSVYS